MFTFTINCLFKKSPNFKILKALTMKFLQQAGHRIKNELSNSSFGRELRFQQQMANDKEHKPGVIINNLPDEVIRKCAESGGKPMFAIIETCNHRPAIVRIVRPGPFEPLNKYMLVPVTENELLLNFKIRQLSNGTQYKIPLCAIIKATFDESSNIKYTVTPSPPKKMRKARLSNSPKYKQSTESEKQEIDDATKLLLLK